MAGDAAVIVEARQAHGADPRLVTRHRSTSLLLANSRVHLDRDAWEMLPDDGVLLMHVRPTDGGAYSWRSRLPGWLQCSAKFVAPVAGIGRGATTLPRLRRRSRRFASRLNPDLTPFAGRRPEEQRRAAARPDLFPLSPAVCRR